MEGSAYTERTLRLFEDRLYPNYRENVGIVLQSYLYRTSADVERAILLKCRVRLCKGAYKEPAAVAYPGKEGRRRELRALHGEADRRWQLSRHRDARSRDHRRGEEVREGEGDPASRFEFQMLYGVRRDMQEQLVREGYNMRVYVPFGTQWYPYLMRRLAERPANLAFITGNVVREMMSGYKQ